MNDLEVIKIVRLAFEADGVWSYVDQSKSMFLLVPHMFAHVVLKDASKYETALDALRRIQARLKDQNEEFEWRVRSSWKIDRVEYKGVYYNEDFTIRAASEIFVELSSESRVVPLRVSFTHQAGEDLKTLTGAAPDNHEQAKLQQVAKTRKFIELLLSAGGEMAWDPLWPGEDRLTINSTALAWILQEERRMTAV